MAGKQDSQGLHQSIGSTNCRPWIGVGLMARGRQRTKGGARLKGELKMERVVGTKQQQWGSSSSQTFLSSSSPLSGPIYMPLPFPALALYTTTVYVRLATARSRRRRSSSERPTGRAGRSLAVRSRQSTAGEGRRCRGRRTWTST
jgi:hypothetical protein